MRDDREDSRAREQQRGDRERAEQAVSDSSAATTSRHALVHRLHVEQREVGIDATHGAAQRRHERERIASRPHDTMRDA